MISLHSRWNVIKSRFLKFCPGLLYVVSNGGNYFVNHWSRPIWFTSMIIPVAISLIDNKPKNCLEAGKSLMYLYRTGVDKDGTNIHISCCNTPRCNVKVNQASKLSKQLIYSLVTSFEVCVRNCDFQVSVVLDSENPPVRHILHDFANSTKTHHRADKYLTGEGQLEILEWYGTGSGVALFEKKLFELQFSLFFQATSVQTHNGKSVNNVQYDTVVAEHLAPLMWAAVDFLANLYIWFQHSFLLLE